MTSSIQGIPTEAIKEGKPGCLSTEDRTGRPIPIPFKERGSRLVFLGAAPSESPRMTHRLHPAGKAERDLSRKPGSVFAGGRML